MSSEVLNESVTSEAADLGLRSPQQWRVYGLKTVPGGISCMLAHTIVLVHLLCTV